MTQHIKEDKTTEIKNERHKHIAKDRTKHEINKEINT